MQRQQHGIWLVAAHFDGSGLDQHVQRGLGGAVAVPAAETVVADAADLGREHGEHAALAVEQPAEVAQQQRRAKGVDLEGGEQLLLVDVSKAFFRHELGAMQHAGGVDDQVKRPLPRHRVRGLFDAGGIGKIKRRLGRATQGDDRCAVRIAAQGIDQCGTDATGCTDDQRAKPFGE